jgi:PHD/YefM family antitoxin component YafN of YafNO toxin-antitoxin module
MSRNVQYVTDANGERTAVILPLDEYEELLEDLHVIRVAEETANEPRIPWEQVKAELVSEGKLDVDA